MNSAINERDGEEGSSTYSLLENSHGTKSIIQDYNEESSSVGESENHIKQENEVCYAINNLSLNVSVNLLAFIGFGFLSYSSHWLSYYGLPPVILWF